MSELLELLSYTAGQASALAKQSVTDEPIVIGEVTVIPVAKLSCGFAGGGKDKKKDRADGISAGAGVKVAKTPVAFLAVCGQEVRTLYVAEETVRKNGVVGALTPLVGALREKLAKPKATDQAPSED